MRAFLILLAVAFLFGCISPQPSPTQTPLASSTPSQISSPSQLPSISSPSPTPSPSELPSPSPEQPSPTPTPTPLPLWQSEGVTVAGTYADSDVVALPDGRYRLYYSAEPEVAGFHGQVYSAISSDGFHFTPEAGERNTWAIFPNIVRLSDGRWRMYFQRFSQEYNKQVIMSAISTDGLTFTDESGARLSAGSVGSLDEHVAAPVVIQLPDGRWRMYYRGGINQKYSPEVPNSQTTSIFSAISSDGLTFTREPGIRIDSRDDITLGLTDGPYSVHLANGTYRLFYWSYSGVYKADSTDGLNFVKESQTIFTTSTNPMMRFPQNPPGDPTVIVFSNGTMRMWYGVHTQGIYSARLEPS